jgi:hypothetical protein
MMSRGLLVASLLAETVILRERGVSSTLPLFVSITNTSEYWIARWSLSSGGHSADPLADDDGLRVWRVRIQFSKKPK